MSTSDTITKTPYHSWCTGSLPEGCARCVQGRKMVLFITGLCSQRCFYCPVSEHKFGHDVVYANEWKIKNPDDPVELFEEARLTEATGAGITGGDPLAKVDRCIDYIKQLKRRFGKNFHIHLYTPLKLVTEEKLQKLYAAGLDEIRFHPDLDDNALWPRLKLARKFGWNVGVEIPAIPGYEEKTKRLIDYIADKVDFLNINELERSDTKTAHFKLDAMRFVQKDDISYGIRGSQEMALEMLAYAKSKGLRMHFCTAKLKDAVQMTSRLQRRSKHIALPCDEHTDEGLLVRGCIYLERLSPGEGYREKLKAADNDSVLKELREAKQKIQALAKTDVFVDESKLRLLLPPKVVKKNALLFRKRLRLVPAIVEEYPTVDAFEVEIDFL
ncbi:radical SAM protein [Candidatus Woesearchaeota archaeon]|nr:radical SAM protein [Candidatus Woesearchaeota archaeon]